LETCDPSSRFEKIESPLLTGIHTLGYTRCMLLPLVDVDRELPDDGCYSYVGDGIHVSYDVEWDDYGSGSYVVSIRNVNIVDFESFDLATGEGAKLSEDLEDWAYSFFILADEGAFLLKHAGYAEEDRY
jgi:hypothetical protein